MTAVVIVIILLLLTLRCSAEAAEVDVRAFTAAGLVNGAGVAAGGKVTDSVTAGVEGLGYFALTDRLSGGAGAGGYARLKGDNWYLRPAAGAVTVRGDWKPYAALTVGREFEASKSETLFWEVGLVYFVPVFYFGRRW